MKTVLVLFVVAVAGVYSQTATISASATVRPTTATRAPGVIANAARPMVTGFTSAMNNALQIGGRAGTFGSNMVNTLGQGIIGAKSQAINAGLKAASTGAAFATGAVADFADIGKNMATMVPLPGVETMAGLGANMVTMGATMANTGSQLAIGAAQNLAQAKMNMASGALESGTGMVSGMIGSGVGMAQSGVTMGGDMALSMIEKADEMVLTGQEMIAKGVEMMNSGMQQANTQMTSVATQAQNAINSASVSGSASGTVSV